MSMIGIQQTEVVMAIIKIQSSQDPSEIKESSFVSSFMLCFTSPQNKQTSISMNWLFNIDISTFYR